jgi:hypothetical protein
VEYLKLHEINPWQFRVLWHMGFALCQQEAMYWDGDAHHLF